jgi:hypothetical protein
MSDIEWMKAEAQVQAFKNIGAGYRLTKFGSHHFGNPTGLTKEEYERRKQNGSKQES